MIRKCREGDFDEIFKIINKAAIVYKGNIPDDRWKEPYMSKKDLEKELNDGVIFFGYEVRGLLLGIMGMQHKKNVTLIRHAYILPEYQGKGFGQCLLEYIKDESKNNPILIGTWSDAHWAISFYSKNGFYLVDDLKKNQLLSKYWDIPERQVETSVVLCQSEYIKIL